MFWYMTLNAMTDPCNSVFITWTLATETKLTEISQQTPRVRTLSFAVKQSPSDRQVSLRLQYML